MMIYPLVEDGDVFCAECELELEREDKLIGVWRRTRYDLYHCADCSVLYWTPESDRILNRQDLMDC